MSNPVIAYIDCKMCGSDKATVHQEAKGKKRFYYRCYEGELGGCGTIQCREPAGQKFIKDNMRALDLNQQDEQSDLAGMEAKEVAQKQAREVRRKKSNLENFLFGGEDDE